MNGMPDSRRSPSAATVLAICMSESAPSCMRAPPEALSRMTGCFFSAPRSIMRVIFSPTTEPMEPPMKRNTKQPSCTGRPPMLPEPAMKASFTPDFLMLLTRRSE